MVKGKLDNHWFEGPKNIEEINELTTPLELIEMIKTKPELVGEVINHYPNRLIKILGKDAFDKVNNFMTLEDMVDLYNNCNKEYLVKRLSTQKLRELGDDFVNEEKSDIQRNIENNLIGRIKKLSINKKK